MDKTHVVPVTSSGDWALVIEGGGMRASYECSVMGALTLARIHPHHFRWIYGVSAGAASAAYYIAGQMGLGYEVWKRHLTGRKFVQRATNLLLRKPIFYLEYLEEVYTLRDPLNVARVVAVNCVNRSVHPADCFACRYGTIKA